MGAIGLAGLFCFGEASHYRNDFIDGGGCNCLRESTVVCVGLADGLDQCGAWN